MSIFNIFAKCKVSAVPCQVQYFIIDADEMEQPRSFSFHEEEDDDDENDDWDEDDDDDDDDD